MQPIEHLREMLLARRSALLHQVDRVENDLRALDENKNTEPELEEEAQDENLSRVLTGLDGRSQAEIEAIDAALTRMADGEYGRCADCGEPIPVERLEALPTAMRCVECAEKRARDESRRAS
jgi:DnaK suppressor protein